MTSDEREVLVAALLADIGTAEKYNALVYDLQAEIARLQAEIERLRLTIRSLADQVATLSVCGGNVTVTMDATLTDAERKAVEDMAHWCEVDAGYCGDAGEQEARQHYAARAATLRGLLERMR